MKYLVNSKPEDWESEIQNGHSRHSRQALERLHFERSGIKTFDSKSLN